MADSPLTFAGKQTVDDTAPVPILAQFSPGTGVYIITFDQVLRPGVIDPVNFNIETTIETWTPDTARILGRTVRGTATAAPPANAADILDYAASPPQLRNLKQTLVAPFVDFPLTLV